MRARRGSISQGHQVPWTRFVKQVAKKPVLGVGRFTDPEKMTEIVTKGIADIIGAARPSISDPWLPKKIEEGRYDDIRVCIGCNVCISRWEIGGPPMICTQNATAGEEYRRGWHPEKFPKTRLGRFRAGGRRRALGRRMRARAAGARLHGAPVRHRRQDRRTSELGRHAARPRRVGLSPRLSRAADRQARQEEQAEPGRARTEADDGRGRPRLRRGEDRHRHRLLVEHGRHQLPDARSHSGRGRLAARSAHAGAGVRGQEADRQARGDSERGHLFHGAEPCGEAQGGRPRGDHRHRRASRQLHALHARVSEHDAPLHELHIHEMHNAFASKIEKGRLQVYDIWGDGSKRTYRGAGHLPREPNKTHRWVDFDSLVLVTGRHSNDQLYRELKAAAGRLGQERREERLSHRRRRGAAADRGCDVLGSPARARDRGAQCAAAAALQARGGGLGHPAHARRHDSRSSTRPVRTRAK